MAKKIELGKSGIGDISDLMHNKSVSDLSWLDIDVDEYRKFQALPKQNLDTIPELEKSLSFDEKEKDGVPSLIPLRPHVMVNANPCDRSHEVIPEISRRVAHYLIRGMDLKQVKEKLFDEFDPSHIRAASKSIASVLSDRGLIGNVYIDANHFPKCAQNSEDKKFVTTRASGAQFILAKSECVDCVHNRGGRCVNLQKRLVEEVPYDRRTFAGFVTKLAAEGRVDSSDLDRAIAGSDADRKSALRVAFCKSPVKPEVAKEDTGLHHHAQRKPAPVSQADVSAFLARKPVPVVTLSSAVRTASVHLMRGGSPESLVSSVDADVRKVAGEHGLLGHSYLDMDALGGCRKTLAFVTKTAAKPDFILRRNACCVCGGKSDGACAKLEEVCPVVSRVEFTKKNFVSSLKRAVRRGAFSVQEARTAAKNVKDVADWKKLCAQANLSQPRQSVQQYAGAGQNAFRGSSIPSRELSDIQVDPEEVRRSVSHIMNKGLSGKSLKAAILQRYTKEDLLRVAALGAKFVAFDGVQGKFFIDPTAYADYGKGCVIGSKHFRNLGAPNLMVGEACTGCNKQTAPGWCSKYSKSLIRQIPESVFRQAAESKKAPCEQELAPVRNPVREFGIKKEELTIEPRKKVTQPDIGLRHKFLKS